MQALEHIAHQLSPGRTHYGARFDKDPCITVSFRIPISLLAQVDALKEEGLARNRTGVFVVLLDAAIDVITAPNGSLGGHNLVDSDELESLSKIQLEKLKAQYL